MNVHHRSIERSGAMAATVLLGVLSLLGGAVVPAAHAAEPSEGYPQCSLKENSYPCADTDGGTVWWPPEVIVVTAPPEQESPPDRAGDAGTQTDQDDNGLPSSGGSHDAGAPPSEPPPAKAPEPPPAPPATFQDAIGVCGAERAALKAARQRYDKAARQFEYADRELEIVGSEALLSIGKTWADVYKNSVLIDRQLIDFILNSLNNEVRESKVRLAADKYSDAYDEVTDSQPPLDSSAAEFDSCMVNAAASSLGSAKLKR